MRIYITILTILFAYTNLTAQESDIRYLENILIVKFKDSAEAQTYLSKTATGSTILGSNSIIEVRSIWNDRSTEMVRKNMLLKGKIQTTTPALDRLKNIYEFHYGSGADAMDLAAQVSKIPGVEYAEPLFIYETHETTNDPINNSTINFHNFDKAWDISKSSSDVIIAIVDSGVDYNHEDLKDKIWLNEEDILGNGIDDDNNGFIDDYYGWDFWDFTSLTGERIGDNNPIGFHSSHGTHVAGIATANPDNGLGLAGTGYNARYMAVKVGGVADDPSTENNESRSIGFGYHGILYAVLNGADIINNSWGGGGFSNFGQDAINVAAEAGVIVIASAGNDAISTPQYPASYDHILSVGALGTSGDVIADYSNYGTTVDVFATGTLQSSVVGVSEYSTFQGTSMSAPVVAGLAALLKSHYPDWTAERITSQIRATSVSIVNSNSQSFEYLLGKGKIDAERALAEPLPGVRIDNASFLNSEGGELEINEEGIIRLFITNDGSDINSLSFSIESLSDEANVLQNSFTINSLANNETTTIDVPVILAPEIIQSLRAEFFIEYSDASLNYSDFKTISFDQLKFDVFNINDLAMSFSPTGNIGFYDASNAEGGIGFVPNSKTANFGDDNLLYEAGLLFSANDLLANTIRSRDGLSDRNFSPISLYSVTSPGVISDADGSTVFAPIRQTLLGDAEITLNTYAFDDDDLSNVIFLNYLVSNTSPNLSLSEVYLGIFNDWDIGDSANNSVNYDSPNDIIYVSEDGDSDHPFAALATIANTSSVLAIENGFSGTDTEFQFNIYDGFSFGEKQNSLRAGTNNTTASSTDVSTVTATGPYYIEPGSTISVGFIYAFGETEQELFDQVNVARNLNLFEISDTNSDVDNFYPSATQIFQNYPNPFNPTTNIQFTLNKLTDVNLSIYNVLGQKVRTIVDEQLQGGIYSYNLTMNNLSSGVYFAILQTSDSQKTIRLSLIK